jgi:predicted nucleic acid-binding protein
MYIIKMCAISGIPIVGSSAVDAEIEEIKKDNNKRGLVRAFYERIVTDELMETASIIERARELRARGICGEFDPYHVAFAEADGAEFLITTDDRFERSAGKLDLKTRVINPINFLGEHFVWLLSST